ncbi:RRQRL motif-containing zinc-binding protein [Streptomyces acidiscabies]|uniref:RRQRL motif-containing zinc-binding protein n=1 Tax=Streptomyces acidiscabies TaxID=42234 RepID=UPI0038F71712
MNQRLTLADCFDPAGERFGIPTYPWRMAPDGYATRRQLRVRGLRPGGQCVAGQILRPRHRREPLTAYLYRVDLARPVRPMTPGMWRAHAAMMRARRTCPACRRDAGYVIPPTLGACVTCAFPGPAAHTPNPCFPEHDDRKDC